MNAETTSRLSDAHAADDPLWGAVANRDARFDGLFIFGVKTTGIYCRPSCPSRKSKRENVVFFGDADAAREAGFRACKRCKPDTPRHPHTEDEQLVSFATATIAAHLDETPSLNALARKAGVAPRRLRAAFQATLGVTPKDYALALQRSRFCGALAGGASVTEAVYEAGYGSPSRVYEHSNRQLGMTPAALAKKGAGETLHYQVTSTPFGFLLVAGTKKGLAAVRLNQDKADLRAEFESDYASAERIESNAHIGDWTRALVDYLNGAPWPENLPLDISATAFQAKVWKALRQIPEGVTATYADIAKAIGQPNASRAVGTACARNEVALAIPCHRVTPAAGGVGQYRWGADLKDRLISEEAKKAQ